MGGRCLRFVHCPVSRRRAKAGHGMYDRFLGMLTPYHLTKRHRKDLSLSAAAFTKDVSRVTKELLWGFSDKLADSWGTYMRLMT